MFASKVMERGIYVANQTSAKPGESEHQTGLAMDVSSPSVNFQLTQYYSQTREGKWLVENAPKHGFIIRYPAGKEYITGYNYEPWHIRYVGKNAAEFIMNENITLEEYLGKV
ncbi:M15 family metallopeptidase [Wukongibacter sp. M2B1]|uniref:M15 family metallopeptidase n=1 Tax=Wukongibacter sp. M2B1 TaxID=3088895 RepID=UPI003D792F56